MLAKIDTQRLELTPKLASSQPPQNQISNRHAIGDLLHDSLPYFYLTAGFAAFFATMYISDWFWVLPYSLLALGGILHIIYIMIRRGPDTDRPDATPAPAAPSD